MPSHDRWRCGDAVTRRPIGGAPMFSITPRFARFLACVAFAALFVGGVVPCRAVQSFEPAIGDPLIEPWRWSTFPELTGFGTQCMAEGRDGSIWFGTADGIWVYNGVVWKFDRASAETMAGVTSIAAAPDGRMYMGNHVGFGFVTPAGQWNRLFTRSGSRFAATQKIVCCRDGSMAAATSDGLLLQRGARWYFYTTAQAAGQIERATTGLEIRPSLPAVVASPGSSRRPGPAHDLVDLAEDPQRRLWMATASGDVLCFTPSADGEGGSWEAYNERNGMVCGRGASLLALRNGSVMVVYSGDAPYANVFENGRWHATRLKEWGLPDDGGFLLETRDGTLWLSARYEIYARRQGVWRKYTRPEFPIPTARNFIMQAADGALWICGTGMEIERVHYETSRWLTLQDLNFQWESPAGEEWFLHRSGRVVRHAGERWTSYGVEDGLIDAPVRLIGTRAGEVWVAGSHEHVAATARFDGARWDRVVHRELSWGIEPRSVFESSDGSLWFGAMVDSSGPKEWRAGILQYRHGDWIHHHQPGRAPTGGDDRNPDTLLPATQRPEPIGKFSIIGESRDGRIWAGRNLLVFHDSHGWHHFVPPPNFPRSYVWQAQPGRETRIGVIEAMFTTREGDLWIGTRQYGAMRYDGKQWTSFHGRAGLLGNSVRSFAQAPDGSIWAATDRDISRYDGLTWTGSLLPAALNVPHEAGSLEATASGRLWVNRTAPEWIRRAWPSAAASDVAKSEFWTICRGTLRVPPQTTIAPAPTKVPPPGNLSVFWSGTAAWREASEARLQYSFRLDDAPWSPFTTEIGHAFFTLQPGRHRLEVRSRDVDFNLDPTPVALDFEVLPPVWRQRWFVLLMALVVGIVATLGTRVMLERGRLRRTNNALAAEIGERHRAEEDLRKLNHELDQRVKSRTAQLEVANRELESFAYSVSHDLRAPLRRIDGFSKALLQDYADKLDDEGKQHLTTVRFGAQQMGRLIDDLLRLSNVTRSSLRFSQVDLSKWVRDVADELAAREPNRRVEFAIAPNLEVTGDGRLLRVALENLLSNAWKFTARRAQAKIEFGVTGDGAERVFFVRDNGAGFDMAQQDRLFQAFRRLHSDEEFPGTGIGLATVNRIIHRHGGRIWAKGEPDVGATFYFTVPSTGIGENVAQ